MTRERKILIACGAVLLAAALVYRFFPSGGISILGGDDLALKNRKIAKYLTVVENRKSVEKEMGQLEKAIASSSHLFLQGKTSALAAVDMQNVLNRIAEKVGITISRIDVGKPEKLENEAISMVTVKFSTVSTTRQLRDLIYALESSKKELRVRSIQSRVGKVAYPEQVSSTITIEGFSVE